VLGRFWILKICNYASFTRFLVVFHEIRGWFWFGFQLVEFHDFWASNSPWLGLLWLFMLFSSPVSLCFGVLMVVLLIFLVAIRAELRLGSESPPLLLNSHVLLLVWLSSIII